MIFGLITKDNQLLRCAIIPGRQVIYHSCSLHVKATFIALLKTRICSTYQIESLTATKVETVIHKEKWQELLPIIDTS